MASPSLHAMHASLHRRVRASSASLPQHLKVPQLSRFLTSRGDPVGGGAYVNTTSTPTSGQERFSLDYPLMGVTATFLLFMLLLVYYFRRRRRQQLEQQMRMQEEEQERAWGRGEGEEGLGGGGRGVGAGSRRGGVGGSIARGGGLSELGICAAGELVTVETLKKERGQKLLGVQSWAQGPEQVQGQETGQGKELRPVQDPGYGQEQGLGNEEGRKGEGDSGTVGEESCSAGTAMSGVRAQADGPTPRNRASETGTAGQEVRRGEEERTGPTAADEVPEEVASRKGGRGQEDSAVTAVTVTGESTREEKQGSESVKESMGLTASSRGENGGDSLDCTICLGVFQPSETLRRLHACGHVFHQECIDEWLRGHCSCPVCRKDLLDSAVDVTVIYFGGQGISVASFRTDAPPGTTLAPGSGPGESLRGTSNHHSTVAATPHSYSTGSTTGSQHYNGAGSNSNNAVLQQQSGVLLPGQSELSGSDRALQRGSARRSLPLEAPRPASFRQAFGLDDAIQRSRRGQH